MARLRSRQFVAATLTTSTTAPATPTVGERWYKPETAVTYQYTANADGTKFWLDVSSGGIGTSAARGVDFVGDIDPHKATNLGVVGSVYYNREKNRHFVCTTATTDAQVWSGRFTAVGGIITTYTTYRVHTFLSSGTFSVEDAISANYLVIAGGGGGSSDGNTTGGAGGGAGGLLTSSGTSGGGASASSALSMAAGTSYTITVGAGGIGSTSRTNDGANGDNSSISGSGITDVVATGGGKAGHTQGANASDGGSGGGTQYNGEGGNATSSPTQGYDGATLTGNLPTGTRNPGAGGGGAGGVGQDGGANVGGNGGIALANSLRTGSAVYYAGGGGGGLYLSGTREGYGGGVETGNKGGGGDGGNNGSTAAGDNGVANSGGGGGGSSLASNTNAPRGGTGGSGIVVIRYAI